MAADLQAALDVLTAGRRRGRRMRTSRRRAHPPQRPQELAPVDVTTEPFPGFPTDLQAQLMGLMCDGGRHLAHPRDDLREPLHACAGAGPPRRQVRLDGDTAYVDGVPKLTGAPGDGDRSARLGVAGDRRARGRGRDHGSAASITSTAASRRWRRSCRAAAPGRARQRLSAGAGRRHAGNRELVQTPVCGPARTAVASHRRLAAFACGM
jgi:hypothetical protein